MSELNKPDDPSSFFPELERLEKAVLEGKDFGLALALADKLLGDAGHQYAAVMRQKSLAEYGLGCLDDAYKSIQSVVTSGEAQIADFQMAAEYALQLRKFKAAVEYLSRTILLSQQGGDAYYLSTCYLERAYAFLELGEKEKALLDLEKLVDDDDAVTWLANIPPLTKQSLLARIE